MLPITTNDIDQESQFGQQKFLGIMEKWNKLPGLPKKLWMQFVSVLHVINKLGVLNLWANTSTSGRKLCMWSRESILATSRLLAAKTLKVLNIEWKAMLNTWTRRNCYHWQWLNNFIWSCFNQSIPPISPSGDFNRLGPSDCPCGLLRFKNYYIQDASWLLK